MIETLNERRPSLSPGRAGPSSLGAEGGQLSLLFDTFVRGRDGATAEGMEKMRTAALAQAARLGFPTVRHEEWKYTNVAPLLQLPLHPAEAPSPAPTAADIAPFLYDLDCHRLVFVDGHYCADLSVLPDKTAGVRMGNLRSFQNEAAVEKQLGAHAKWDENFFTAFNTSFFTDGAFISLPEGHQAEKPVHLLFLRSSARPGATALPRTLILAPRGAKMVVLETHISLTETPGLTNAVTEFVLGRDAQVEHIKIQQESERTFHVAAIQAVQAQGSVWTSHSIAAGARLARNQVQTLFAEPRGVAVLNGLYLGQGEQLVDHHTVVDHAQPLCESHEFYHGILAGRAHGVFNGKIFVREDAQKTNAKQTNRNLLLSDNASIDTKPQLEIFADDVKCTHGAVVGQLNEDQLFYLQARGIGIDQARRILVQAFAADVVERISLAPVRERLELLIAERFQSDAA